MSAPQMFTGSNRMGILNSRVRISSPDPFNGLRGHDYIRARGLALRVPMKGTRIADAECQCRPCVLQRLLPAVQSICASFDRRQIPDLQEIPWNDLNSEMAHCLLDAQTIIGA